MRGMAPQIHRVKAYRTQQVIRILQEGFVAGPEDGEARIGQLLVSQRVFRLAKPMDAAIKFDDEPELGTQEVCNRACNGRLAAKLQTIKSSVAEHFP